MTNQKKENQHHGKRIVVQSLGQISMNTVFRVDGTDGDPLIRIDRNKEGKYELHWLHPYAKCEIGEFDSFLEAEDALGKYYGYENVTEIGV